MLFNCSAKAIKKAPPKSKRKHAKELNVYEKTVRTVITQDTSRGLDSLDYATWGVLENKSNATSRPNIGSRNSGIEKEWN